jgi:hypothetical protein
MLIGQTRRNVPGALLKFIHTFNVLLVLLPSAYEDIDLHAQTVSPPRSWTPVRTLTRRRGGGGSRAEAAVRVSGPATLGHGVLRLVTFYLVGVHLLSASISS